METRMAHQLDRVARLLADSCKGYSEAAEIADDPALKEMFLDRSRRRRAIMDEFREVLPATMAGEEGGSTPGAAHRLFINLKRLVQDDTKVALTEVERGESMFVEALDEAARDTMLTGNARTLVDRLRTEVENDRNRFSQMTVS
jgi:uncharacterized protein (TIGR02284 family)